MQRFDNGISLTSIRNGLWSLTAFGIVACASAPMPVEKLAVAKTSIERAEQAQAAQFAQVELQAARTKLVAAHSAADKRDGEAAARMADQADVDAQLAESTARAKQQEQLVTELDAGLRDLRKETLRRDNSGSAMPQQPPPPPASPPQR